MDETTSNNEKKQKLSLKDKLKNFDIKSIPGKIKDININLHDSYSKIQSCIPVYVTVCFVAFTIMIVTAFSVFFTTVKGPEKVLVPNVVGKKLEDALLEMQVKELYPKINLRYSDVPGDEGLILDQSPESGSIVKGYSRVSLVVSRGVIVDKIDNYVGQNLDDVQMKLQTLFAGQTRPLIVLASPEYKPDAQAAGTILEQDPPAGTSISEPVTVQLIVSRGPNYENTRPPYIVGQTVNDLLQTITRHKIVFDISSHTATDEEKPGTVVAQQTFEDEFVPNYTRMTVEMALPSKAIKDNVYGIFSEKLASYPYPVPMRLEATPAEGDPYTIVNFNHPGGMLTLPYAVPKGTTLTLYVVDKVTAKKVAN